MPSPQETPKTQLPFGHWPSPLSAQTLASGSARYGEPKIVTGGIVWPQTLPEDAGRATLMFSPFTDSSMRSANASPSGDGEPIALLPAPWNIRSKVHEYGGGAYALDDVKQRLYFVNADDQQIYRYDLHDSGPPQPVTDRPLSRFADLVLHPFGQWLFAVRECFDSTDNQHPAASIVAIDLRQEAEPPIAPRVLASGEDFYAAITVSPSGEKIAFISWCHPNMPWDNTQLWQLQWHCDGTFEKARVLIDSLSVPAASQSIVQPKYSPNNELYYVSDKTGWWNIYAYAQQSDKQLPIVAIEAECATPQWTFG
ncbi:MAG TPA: S9 family peptidase, partial [Marinagarivorans sp.]